MPTPSTFRTLIPLVAVFLLVSVLVFAMQGQLTRWGFDWKIIALGNAVLFLISVFSWYMHNRAMTASGSLAFLKFVYSGFFGKFLLVIAFVLVYKFASGASFNVYGLAICLFLYLVYTLIEVSALLKMNKRKNA